MNIKKILPILFLIPLSLFASQILSYNIYDRTDRADVMLTFDTPFHGVIKQARNNSKIIIKLEDATIESPKIKKVGSRYLQSLVMTPLENKTQIVANVGTNVKLMASKTADGYGLRLRFIDKSTHNKSSTGMQNNAQQKMDLSALPTKKDEGITTRYYIVIAILILGIALLLYLRKKIPSSKKENNNTQGNGSSWLFNANKSQEQEPQQQENTHEHSSNEVHIRFQKALDQNNSVIMLDFGPQSYLILMGNGNILLDKFTENIPTTQTEFETILQSRHQELENFLNAQENNDLQENISQIKSPTSLHKQESLNLYKEKASLIYTD